MEHRLIETAVSNIWGNRQQSEFAEAMENVKDFDITKLSAQDYFISLNESIRQVIEMREGIEIGFSDLQLRKEGSNERRIKTLEDGKIYPYTSFVINKKRRGFPCFYRMNITPFTAWLNEMGPIGKNYCKEEKLTTRMLTKAIKDFHTQLFGEKFSEKFKEYHQLVKDKKVKEIEDKAKLELNEVESIYDTLI